MIRSARYGYDDLESPRRTLPRALYTSVGVVALVYVAVTMASQMLVPDRLLAEQKAVAVALLGADRNLACLGGAVGSRRLAFVRSRA